MTYTIPYGVLEKRILELGASEEALKSHITEFSQPEVEIGDIRFDTLFDIRKIQQLQDQFAAATGVGSIIAHPDGSPITRPSNFCRLCSDIIRKTDIGRANCCKSDAVIGRFSADAPTIQHCFSGGLWEAGASIFVGKTHIANWIIGQVRDETRPEEKIREYARKIGADETATVEAYREVPAMSRERLEQVARMLSTLVDQLSTIAYQNLLQTRRIGELKDAKTILARHRTHLERLLRGQTEDLSRKSKELQQKIVERNNLQVKLLHAMDIARLGPWEYDYSEDRFTFNDHFYKLFRTSAEEIGGFTMSSSDYVERFVHPDDIPFVKKKIREFAKTDDPVSSRLFEHRIRYADNTTGHIVIRRLPVKDAQGRTVKVYGVHQDITEPKQAEAERERFMSAMEQVGEMVSITDPRGRIEYVNPAFEKTTGYCREEVIGREPDFLEDSPDNAFLKESWEAVSNGNAWNGNVVNKRADGTLFTVSASISPVRNDSGKIVNFIAVARDITEHLQLEDQLRQAQKMESIGRLAGGVAHDYNNMLGVIIGHADLALNKATPDNPLRSHLKTILDAAERSASITRQLLAFARKQTIQPKIIDLNQTVGHMLKMLQRLIGEQIELAWLPGADLWPIKMDPSQIDQIMANLLVNAKDAIGERGKITIETDIVTLDEAYCANNIGFLPGDFTMLAVSDNGCGMDRETLAKIFEPFFTTKDANHGTGLGLSTVYGIIRQNNGFINVYSEPGEGTTFRIYLPRRQGEANNAASRTEAQLPETKGETVLLVEDEKILIEMTERILKRLGYQVLTADTPMKALELAEEHADEIDLLITDVVMPGMNGRELAMEFRRRHPNVKILFISGYTANVIVQQGVLDPEVNFLQKPFSISELAKKTRAILDDQ